VRFTIFERKLMKPRVIQSIESQEYFFEEGCHILELWNSPHDPGLSIARARVEPGQKTRWHQLNDLVERYVILEGEGRVEIGHLSPEDVTHGDLVIIPPGCPQRIQNIGKTDLVFLAICTPRFSREKYANVQGTTDSESHPE